MNQWGDIASLGVNLLGNIDFSSIGNKVGQWFNNNWANGKMFDSNAIDTSFAFA